MHSWRLLQQAQIPLNSAQSRRPKPGTYLLILGDSGKTWAWPDLSTRCESLAAALSEAEELRAALNVRLGQLESQVWKRILADNPVAVTGKKLSLFCF